jgi:uncharacterized protein with GYD domain
LTIIDLREHVLISACVLIRSRRGEFDEVVDRIKQFDVVKLVFPVLGRFDVVVDVEAPDIKNLGTAVLRMGKIAGVVFTETLVEVQHEEG